MRFKRESSATPTTCPRPGRQCMLFALTLVALACYLGATASGQQAAAVKGEWRYCPGQAIP